MTSLVIGESLSVVMLVAVMAALLLVLLGIAGLGAALFGFFIVRLTGIEGSRLVGSAIR